MNRKRKTNAFHTWIRRVGRIEVARLLGVTPMAVSHWKWGTSLPKTTQMRKIRKLSKGEVTYESIIDGAKKEAHR